MPPDDPLGRHGPTLSAFLSKKPALPEPKRQPCPYGGFLPVVRTATPPAPAPCFPAALSSGSGQVPFPRAVLLHVVGPRLRAAHT